MKSRTIMWFSRLWAVLDRSRADSNTDQSEKLAITDRQPRGRPIQTLKACITGGRETLTHSIYVVTHWPIFHATQCLGAAKDLFCVIMESLKWVIVRFLPWALVGLIIYFLCDIGDYFTYLEACNTPLVRRVIRMSTLIPFLGDKTPSYESICPPSNIVSSTIICKMLNLDPVEFHFCAPLTEQPLDPLQPKEPSPFAEPSVESMERTVRLEGYGNARNPLSMDIRTWREALYESIRALDSMRFEHDFAAKAIPKMHEITDLTLDLSRSMEKFSTGMHWFMLTHRTATLLVIYELNWATHNISTWSYLCELFFPRPEIIHKILQISGRWLPLSQSMIARLTPFFSARPQPLNVHGQTSVPVIINNYVTTMKPALEPASKITNTTEGILKRQLDLLAEIHELFKGGQYGKSYKYNTQQKGWMMGFMIGVIAKLTGWKFKQEEIVALQHFEHDSKLLLDALQQMKNWLQETSVDLERLAAISTNLELHSNNGKIDRANGKVDFELSSIEFNRDIMRIWIADMNHAVKQMTEKAEAMAKERRDEYQKERTRDKQQRKTPPAKVWKVVKLPGKHTNRG